MVSRLSLVLLVLVAGCLGAPSPASDVETSPPPATATPTLPSTSTPTSETTGSSSETTAYATGCPPRLHIEAATESELERADEEDVVAYGNLSAERRVEFDRALNATGSVELDSVPETWSRPRVVTYRGESYATVVSVC